MNGNETDDTYDDKGSEISESSRRATSFISDVDYMNDENTTLNEILATKHDLMAKLEAARQTKKQYYHRKQELEDQINELNEKAGLTLKLLDEKKDQLSFENEELRDEIESNPSIEFLEEQFAILKQAVPNSPERNMVAVVDVDPFIELGILGENETLAVLPQRLKKMTDELYEYQKNKSPIRGSPKTYNFMALDESEEETLKRRIRTLVNTYTVSIKQAQSELVKFENEVDQLNQVLSSHKQKAMRSPRKMIDSDQVSDIIASVGGNPEFLHESGINSFEYYNQAFSVESRFNSLYAITEDQEAPLEKFIRSVSRRSSPMKKNFFSTPKKY